MNAYGFKDCVVIYTTTEKVRYDSDGEVVGKETALTARKVNLDEDRSQSERA